MPLELSQSWKGSSWHQDFQGSVREGISGSAPHLTFQEPPGSSSWTLPGAGPHSGLSWLLLSMFQTQTRGTALAGCESAPAFVSLEPNPTPASTNRDFEPGFVTHTFPAGSAAAAELTLLPKELIFLSFPIH